MVTSYMQPLATRLNLEPVLWELARFVGYDGKSTAEVKAFMEGHSAKHGDHKARMAFQELTMTDPQTGRTALRPNAVRACRVLLGPTKDAPEFQSYWSKEIFQAGMTEPHIPKKEATKEEPNKEPKPKRTRKVKAEAQEGRSPESYAADAKRCNRRQLLCMLRDARQKLKQHGKDRFCGKEAKKELEATVAELDARNIPLPPEGQETAEYDKKTG